MAKERDAIGKTPGFSASLRGILVIW